MLCAEQSVVHVVPVLHTYTETRHATTSPNHAGIADNVGYKINRPALHAERAGTKTCARVPASLALMTRHKRVALH